MPIEDLQLVIIDCVNACLKNNNQNTFPQPEVEDLLSIKEAAKFLHLSVPTIYGYVSKNEIPFSKKGKRLYFSKQELTEWIKTGRSKTTLEISSEANTYLKVKKG